MLNKAQEATKVPKAAIVIGGGVVFAGILWAAFGPGLLTNLIGFAFPAWASFKAIESTEKEDDTLWLTYWTVFSVFSIIETGADTIEHYLPMYFPMKFAFLIWLMAPPTRGADFIYKNFLRKFLIDNEDSIDRNLHQAEEFSKEVAEVTEETAKEKAEEMKEDFVNVEKTDEE